MDQGLHWQGRPCNIQGILGGLDWGYLMSASILIRSNTLPVVRDEAFKAEKRVVPLTR